MGWKTCVNAPCPRAAKIAPSSTEAPTSLSIPVRICYCPAASARWQLLGRIRRRARDQRLNGRGDIVGTEDRRGAHRAPAEIEGGFGVVGKAELVALRISGIEGLQAPLRVIKSEGGLTEVLPRLAVGHGQLHLQERRRKSGGGAGPAGPEHTHPPGQAGVRPEKARRAVDQGEVLIQAAEATEESSGLHVLLQ